MRSNQTFAVTAIIGLAFFAGCNPHSEHQTSDDKASKDSDGFHIIKYGSSDPKLEPTMRIGGVLEVRTTNGGPVVLQSQEEDQRKAAERQKQAAKANEPSQPQ